MNNNDQTFNFDEFDKKLNAEQFQKDLAEAKAAANDTDYPEIPKGDYDVKIERMEIKLTKTNPAPMFSVMLRIQDGQFKNACLFFNRKIANNKVSDKWNDAKAVQTVISWVDKLQTETIPEFISYTQFAQCIADIFDEWSEYDLTMKVTYDPDKFNPVSIKEIYED